MDSAIPPRPPAKINGKANPSYHRWNMLYKPGYKEQRNKRRKEKRRDDPEYAARLKEWSQKYRQRPGVKARDKARMDEYAREYRKRPENKARAREYLQRPEVKARRRAHDRKRRQKPEDRVIVCSYNRVYRALPEVKARAREYLQRPEVQARRTLYRQSAEFKLKSRAYTLKNRRATRLHTSQKKKARKGMVYFFESLMPGYYKVGCTTNWEARRKTYRGPSTIGNLIYLQEHTHMFYGETCLKTIVEDMGMEKCNGPHGDWYIDRIKTDP